MYKHANNLLPPAINNLYIENCDLHNYPTRQKYLLHVNKSNINIYSKCFGNTSARIWNDMQPKIEVNLSISKFKISSKTIYKNIHLNLNIQNNNIITCIMQCLSFSLFVSHYITLPFYVIHASTVVKTIQRMHISQTDNKS